MANEIRARYECSQSELYAICTLAWNRCKTAQATIAAAFPEYTVLYIDGKLADIVTVQNTPDFQARNLITETDHILLTQLAQPAIANWDFLERYIIRSFQSNKPLIKPNVEAAGKPYYAAATREDPNWEDLKQMLINGENYITDHAATTLAGIIPVGFAADYTTAKDDFIDKYNTFTSDTVAAPGDTSDKIIANNNLYEALMLMLGDLLTVTPAPTKNQISFTYLKSVISSPGPAGLKGTITDFANDNPLEGVLLRLTPSGHETTSDADGKYDFGNIASGKYMLEISLDAYETRNENVIIHTGVTSTKNYTLTSDLTSVVVNAEVTSGTIADVITPDFVFTDTSTIQVIIVSNEIRLSYAPASGPAMGPTVWYIPPGTENKTKDAFIAVTGYSAINKYLKAECIGPSNGSYTITFNNVILVEE